jgi:alpha-L-fucosidase
MGPRGSAAIEDGLALLEKRHHALDLIRGVHGLVHGAARSIAGRSVQGKRPGPGRAGGRRCFVSCTGHVTALAPILVALLLGSTAAARPALCPPARYATSGAAIGPDGTDVIIDVGTEVSLSAGCARVAPRSLRRSRAGTRVRAKWTACDGFRGPVALRAVAVDACARLAGTLRSGGETWTIDAERLDCGDGILEATAPAVPYEGTVESLATHALPRWFEDAKFGIMIHWGIFSVPAWAETVLDPEEWLRNLDKLLEPPLYGAEWFSHIPYVEWYPNTMLIEDSPTRLRHLGLYGADFAYEDFRPAFETAAQAWSAEAWADLFRDAGARYVVFVTKHHDGFALWPSAVPHPTRAGWHATRDYVGELGAAVRRRCMRMATYYSGGLDWAVQPGPIRNVFDVPLVQPQSAEYVAYADAQWRELIARYQPAVMWNDLGYPVDADELSLFADYYNTVPDGVVNDRFVTLPPYTHHDYVTPEFNVPSEALAEKFETVRGMDRGFGYNQNSTEADFTTARGLVTQLIDVVSKNGNLLLNVGPMADGSIPAPQAERLHAIGAWLGANGEAIFATRPWTRAEGTTAEGAAVRFTAGADGATVYALLLDDVAERTVTLQDVGTRVRRVRLLGGATRIKWRFAGDDLVITLRAPLRAGPHALALDGLRS